MNQKPSQSRLPASRRHAGGAAGADLAGTCLLLLTASTIETSPAIHRIGAAGLDPAARSRPSAIKPPGRTLGQRNGALQVFPAGDVVGEHVDHEEVSDCGGRLLAER